MLTDKNFLDHTSACPNIVITIPTSSKRSDFKIEKNKTNGKPFNFCTHKCPIASMDVNLYLSFNKPIKHNQSPVSSPKSTISFYSSDDEHPHARAEYTDFDFTDLKYDEFNEKHSYSENHDFAYTQISRERDDSDYIPSKKRKLVEFPGENNTNFRCTCLMSKYNDQRLEHTTCQAIAQLRKRRYIKNVDFGSCASSAQKLKDQLKALSGKGVIQNCMGKPEDELKREKAVAIPMKKEMIGQKRTLFDEVRDAIELGYCHHCLEVILIKDTTHPIKKVVPNNSVAGLVWTGPNLPKGAQVIFGVYVGEIKPSREISEEKVDYAIEISWNDPHKRFIKDKLNRKKISFHPLRNKHISGKALTESEWDKNLDNEIGWDFLNKRIILPPDFYFTLDSYEAFNQMSMMNDSRLLTVDKRLETNAKFYKVYYEGWPYNVVTNNPSRVLEHGEELVVNCGAAYRFGHLEPITKNSLLEQALSKADMVDEHKLYCPDGWVKRHLFFDSIDKMIDSVPDVAWESDDDLPDISDSDESGTNSNISNI